MYTVVEGKEQDIDSWMALVEGVRATFPGLETETALEAHRRTVISFMRRRCALCVKDDGGVIGVLLFSQEHNMICCLAVSDGYRRRGIGSRLLAYAVERLDRTRPITVTTFLAEDKRGAAPRALYQKFGFVPEGLTEEFGCPSQLFVLAPGCGAMDPHAQNRTEPDV